MSQSTHHTCAAVGCAMQIPRGLLMCRHHWRMVPAELQRLVHRHWEAVQRREPNAIQHYLAAVDAATDVVGLREKTFSAAIDGGPR